MKSSTNNRFDPIDALRGIAALLVVWQHSSEAFIKVTGVAQYGTILADIAKDYDFGRVGIICFFLISGFVIPSSLKNKQKSGVEHFVIRRFFRLYPAYWFSIFLFVVVSLIFKIPMNNANIIANTTMVQSYFNEPHLIGLYWTLQVELVFYAICALLFYFKLLRNDKLIFTLMTLSFGVFALIQYMNFMTETQLAISKETQLLPYILSTMFLGYFYRKIFDYISNNQKPNKSLLSYTIIGTMMCLGLPLFLLISNFFGYEIITNSYRFGAGHSIGFLLFFIGILYLKKIPKVLLFMGTISYSLYLFHPIMMRTLSQLIIKYDELLGFHVSFYMAIVTVMSIVLAFIIYKFIEKPFINYGYRLTKHD